MVCLYLIRGVCLHSEIKCRKPESLYLFYSHILYQNTTFEVRYWLRQNAQKSIISPIFNRTKNPIFHTKNPHNPWKINISSNSSKNHKNYPILLSYHTAKFILKNIQNTTKIKYFNQFSKLFYPIFIEVHFLHQRFIIPTVHFLQI